MESITLTKESNDLLKMNDALFGYGDWRDECIDWEANEHNGCQSAPFACLNFSEGKILQI